MKKKVCVLDTNQLCNCTGAKCNKVFCNGETVEVTEENGCLVEYSAVYSGITKGHGTIVGHRVFKKNGEFEGLLTGEIGHRSVRYVESVSFFFEVSV